MKTTLQEKPGIEDIAKMAMQWGARHLKDYGSTRSRHDFTQPQLMACLIVRACLRTTYRGLFNLLAASPGLRAELGMGHKLPHYTTLQKFNGRNRILEIAELLLYNAAPAPFPQADNLDLAHTPRRGASHRRDAPKSWPSRSNSGSIHPGLSHPLNGRRSSGMGVKTQILQPANSEQ